MTQKEKLREAFITIQKIKSTAQAIVIDCTEYSSTASTYAKHIMEHCNNCLKLLK